MKRFVDELDLGVVLTLQELNHKRQVDPLIILKSC